MDRILHRSFCSFEEDIGQSSFIILTDVNNNADIYYVARKDAMYVLACERSQETRRVHVLGMLVLLILVNLVKKNSDRVVARLFVYVRIVM